MAATDPVCLTVAPLEQGLVLDAPAIAVITETQLFGERARQERRRRAAGARSRRDHPRPHRSQSRGAGGARGSRGRSLPRPADADRRRPSRPSFSCIEYAGGDKLYVPVASLHLISRYTGASPEDGPAAQARRRPVGSAPGARPREQRPRRGGRTARHLRAPRRAPGPCLAPPTATNTRAFAAAFPFEETPDQQRAIERCSATCSRR